MDGRESFCKKEVPITEATENKKERKRENRKCRKLHKYRFMLKSKRRCHSKILHHFLLLGAQFNTFKKVFQLWAKQLGQPEKNNQLIKRGA
jgi:hypothetical protein